ncbi:MAG: fasciclin domain-containing protein [Actinomycetota bacterium]
MSMRILVTFLAFSLVASCGGDSEEADEPPDSPSPSPSPMGPAPTPTEIPGPEEGVLAILDADGRFTTFLGILLLESSERVPMFLSSPVWNNTLFAPTDEAFETLPDGTLDYLLSDDPQAEFDLLRVIEHHVVDTVRPVSDFKPGELTTIAGTLQVTIEGDRVMVDDATVIQADVEASNGIVHVIDRVLIPEAVEIG